MQSDSPQDPGATPDTRSLTDLWRDLGRIDDPNAFNNFQRRLHQVADLHTQAVARDHAQVEHPEVAWDAHAAVFTTGRFEGRAR